MAVLGGAKQVSRSGKQRKWPTVADREIDVMSAQMLAVGEMKAVIAARWHILIARTVSGYYAINNRCSHAASPLAAGQLRHSQVMCPRHGARFDLASGKCVGAAYSPLRTFPLRLENGRLIVTVPSTPPELSEIPIA